MRIGREIERNDFVKLKLEDLTYGELSKVLTEENLIYQVSSKSWDQKSVYLEGFGWIDKSKIILDRKWM